MCIVKIVFLAGGIEKNHKYCIWNKDIVFLFNKQITDQEIQVFSGWIGGDIL